jgi:16S rRNA (cytosine967-C5)-methyltransferase
LLDAAVAVLAPGGTLVYCVCSLQPEEGAARTEAFIKRHPDFHRLPVQASEIGGLTEILTSSGDLRTLPSHLADRGGMDGFYACRLIKGR